MYCDTLNLRSTNTREDDDAFKRFLAQDFEKNQERTRQETAHDCTPHLPNTAKGSLVDSDLQQLMKNKADLEKNLFRLEEQERKLNQRASILCEKITQVIKKRNREKQRAISQLQDTNAKMENLLGLENSIEETKEENIEKQEDINYLREKIKALETEFGDLTKEATTPTPVLADSKEKQKPQSGDPSRSKRDDEETDGKPLDVFPV